jgi:hypothetical protein
MNKFLNNKSKNFFIDDINVSYNIDRDREFFLTLPTYHLCVFFKT